MRKPLLFHRYFEFVKNISTTKRTTKKMTKFKNYCVSISPILHKKLDTHISILKNLLKKDLKKQDWIKEAIREKLERDINAPEMIKEKALGLHLDPMTHQRIGKHVDMIRQFQYSFSKNKWILDAIQERLDQEIVIGKVNEKQ